MFYFAYFRKRIENIPLPAFHSKELDNILTGGEKIIFGYIQKKKTGFEVPKFWIPFIYKSVVYSEILNKYISVHMTKRVIELIHKHRGFDSYLLEVRLHKSQHFFCDKFQKITLSF